jgi:probable HAF family extracellular repeat protein
MIVRILRFDHGGTNVRGMHRSTLQLVSALALCGLIASGAQADAIYSVTDLGPASPSANVSGGSQSSTSNTYPYLSGQDLLPSNGKYLTALGPAQQAAFQSGSFDLYAHPATTSLYNETFYPTQSGGAYDIAGTGTGSDSVSRFQMSTSNNLGVTVGTAADGSSSVAERLVVFTSDPHTVNQQITASSSQQVTSPGFVNTLFTRSDSTYSQFYGMATGINDHNNIALTEYTYTPGSSGAVITVLTPHLMIGTVDTPLGTLGGANGVAYALNNSNQVVGWSQLANGAQHAYLYSNGTMQDLNLLIPLVAGITLTSAVGIDAAGDIVAYGIDPSGQSHEYLLTPAESPVPEPSSLAVMSLAITALAIRQVRHRGRR